jgi:hypothetical protein
LVEVVLSRLWAQEAFSRAELLVLTMLEPCVGIEFAAL